MSRTENCVSVATPSKSPSKLDETISNECGICFGQPGLHYGASCIKNYQREISMENLRKSKRIEQVVSAVQPLLCELFSVQDLQALRDDVDCVEGKVEKAKTESKEWRDEVMGELNKLKQKFDNILTSHRKILGEIQEMRTLFSPSDNMPQTASSQQADETSAAEKKSKKKRRKTDAPCIVPAPSQQLPDPIPEPNVSSHIDGGNPENGKQPSEATEQTQEIPQQPKASWANVVKGYKGTAHSVRKSLERIIGSKTMEADDVDHVFAPPEPHAESQRDFYVRGFKPDITEDQIRQELFRRGIKKIKYVKVKPYNADPSNKNCWTSARISVTYQETKLFCSSNFWEKHFTVMPWRWEKPDPSALKNSVN